MLSQINWAAGGASVQAKQLFGPYGNVRYHPGTFNTAKGFTGQYNDQLTGLDYFNARYYDPVAGVFLSPDSVQGNVSGMNPYGYVGGNPETATDPSGQAFINDQEIESLAEGAAYVEVPQVYQDAFSDGPTLDPTVAPTVSATAGDTTYTYDPTSDVILINKPGQLVPQGYTVYAGSAYSQAISQLNQLLASMGGTAIDSAVLAKHGISDLLPTPSGPQPQTGSGGQGGKPPLPPAPTAASPQPCSFTPDTAVTTKQGKEPIGKVHTGEKVLAYNPKTHLMEDEPILHVWTHTDHDLVDLTLTSYLPVQHDKLVKSSEVIHTNQKHPFLTEEKGFVPVGQIKLGMHILRADGTYGVVTGWKSVPGTSVMYNLEVAQDHTFTVGDGQWVVHNCTPDDVRKLAERAQRLRETENLGPRWTPELHTPNAGSALVQFTDQGVTTTFWEDFFSSGAKGHVEPQAVDWAIKIINSVNQLMGNGLDFTVKVLTQYEPCGGPGGCNFMINNDVWQSQLDQAAGSPVEFQIWHDPDVGDPYFWIGRP